MLSNSCHNTPNAAVGRLIGSLKGLAECAERVSWYRCCGASESLKRIFQGAKHEQEQRLDRRMVILVGEWRAALSFSERPRTDGNLIIVNARCGVLDQPPSPIIQPGSFSENVVRQRTLNQEVGATAQQVLELKRPQVVRPHLLTLRGRRRGFFFAKSLSMTTVTCNPSSGEKRLSRQVELSRLCSCCETGGRGLKVSHPQRSRIKRGAA